MTGPTRNAWLLHPDHFSTRWLRLQLVWMMACALAALWLFENSDLDRTISLMFYDSGTSTFPWRRDWWLEALLHRSAKHLTYLLVALTLLVCWQGWQGRMPRLPRRNALLAALGMILIPVCTTVLKHLTQRYCPWDVVDFGGYAPYLGLFDPVPAGLKAGQCFPAGHASTGYLWIVWGLALRPVGKWWARSGLLVGLTAGSVLGGARMIQGAHFLSHTLATLWLAWFISLLLAFWVRADLRLPGSVSGAASARQGQLQCGAQTP